MFMGNKKESESDKRRRKSRENHAKGKAVENLIRDRYILHGYIVTRTGRGHDFKVTKKDWHGKIIEVLNIEVKFGKSPLSSLQVENSYKHRGHYRVERLTLPPIYWQDYQL
jgi:hypothetical protein